MQITLEGCAAEGALAFFAGIHFSSDSFPEGFAFGWYEPTTQEHALWLSGYAACVFLDNDDSTESGRVRPA